MSRKVLVKILILHLVAGIALGGASKVVAVDCGKGDSIQKALEDKAPDLVVEIRGICQEEVVIRRDNVTLRGADPANDGVRALDPDRPWGAAVLVREARNIGVENLSFSNGWNGLRASNTRRILRAANCRFVDNSVYGLAAIGSAVNVADGYFDGNHSGAIAASESALVTCDRCTMLSSQGTSDEVAISVDYGSTVFLSDNSLVEGEVGATINRGSHLRMIDSKIDATLDAVDVVNGSQALIFFSQLGGALFVNRNSLLQLESVQQFSNPLEENDVFHDSSLLARGRADNPTSLMGRLTIGPLSRGTLLANSVNQGDLSCDALNLANFACPDPNLITGTTSGCGGCVKPPACVPGSGQEYVISGGLDPNAGILVDDILRVYVNGDLIAEVNQGGGCCPPVLPIHFVANTGDQLRVVAQDGNNCYSLGALYLQKANGSCLTQLAMAFSGPACGSEPPEQVFFDQTFTLP